MTTKLSTSLLVAAALTLGACKKKTPEAGVDMAVTETSSKKAADHDHAAVIAEMSANFQRVHFELDKADLNADGKAALAANAAILAEHPRLSVEIQGHADERGTTDYNLALGQRRANAVRDALRAEGVSPRRVTVVSFGEEQPLESASNEVAWAANRRAEFRILEGAEPNVAGTVQ